MNKRGSASGVTTGAGGLSWFRRGEHLFERIVGRLRQRCCYFASLPGCELEVSPTEDGILGLRFRGPLHMYRTCTGHVETIFPCDSITAGSLWQSRSAEKFAKVTNMPHLILDGK